MASLNLTITIPDDKATDVLNTLTDAYGYNPNDNQGNPIQGYPTRAQFLKEQIREMLRVKYKEAKQSVALKSAMDSANAALEAVTFS